ncbi:hypothetical protein Catovirus_1_53 [Catovirus CTV1]|uniref:Uncharacterized protein n=1 Tax=Catovirus CTV1 TaxID=1977631 RepID=A0A1V0S8H0_9VIRU|nr:hypothetical protein Catovirus_1_53 [Catovirus CTV1]
MNHKNENTNALEHFIKTGARVVLMDANLSIKSYEIMSKMDNLDNYTLIVNKYQKLKDWELVFVNGEEQTKLIKNDLENNHKVCVASLSKSMIDSHYSIIIPDHIIYSSETDNEENLKKL